MDLFKNFFRKIKNRKLAIDELSLFLIFIALILSMVMAFFKLNQFVFLAWLLLIIAYWRSYSRKRLQRIKENQTFIKYSFPILSYSKNFMRRFSRKESYIYFKCKSCRQELRVPKKTNHIKVTCPKCNYSFIKTTIRGHLNKGRKETS